MQYLKQALNVIQLLFQSFAANGNPEDSYDNGYDFGSMPKYGNQYGGIAESFSNMTEVKPEMEQGKPRILLMGLRRFVGVKYSESLKFELRSMDFRHLIKLFSFHTVQFSDTLSI